MYRFRFSKDVVISTIVKTNTTKNLKIKANIRTKIIKTKNPNITTKKRSTHGFVAVVAPSC